MLAIQGSTVCSFSWFQTFSVFWILCLFFWVFLFYRRFGTLCQVHLQRLDVEYEVYSTTCFKRWNWQWVPKRRQTTIWRRGNTQNNRYNNMLFLFHIGARNKLRQKTFWRSALFSTLKKCCVQYLLKKCVVQYTQEVLCSVPSEEVRCSVHSRSAVFITFGRSALFIGMDCVTILQCTVR
jgi:hypothetical protein